MAEYIDREAVVMELNKTYDHMNAMGAQFYSGFMNAVHRIKDFPSADVAPVRHGRWERTADGAVLCTACKRKMNPSQYGYAFCSLCGAKMRRAKGLTDE